MPTNFRDDMGNNRQAGTNGTVNWELETTNDHALFELDGITGDITYIGTGEAITATHTSLTIRVHTFTLGGFAGVEGHASRGWAHFVVTVDLVSIGVFRDSPVTETKNKRMILTKPLQDMKASLYDSLPNHYQSSDFVENVYDAVIPELEVIALASSAYDKSEENPNSLIDNEIDLILSGDIGYGNDKILYQNYVVSANSFLREYSGQYGITFSDAEANVYDEIRRRLLFRSRTNDYLSEQDLIDEFNFIYPDAIESLLVTHNIYHIQFRLNDNAPDVITALVQEKIRQLVPAHMEYNFVSLSTILRLSREPIGKLSDLIGYLVARD